MRTRFTLKPLEKLDLTVLAINSHVKGYKLCWNINKTLQVAFEKKEYHNIQDELWFARYTYICDEGVEYNLLANRSKQGYLIPSQKSINYFLIIENDCWKKDKKDKKDFIRNLSKIKDILLVFELDANSFKHTERLIFNDKKN